MMSSSAYGIALLFSCCCVALGQGAARPYAKYYPARIPLGGKEGPPNHVYASSSPHRHLHPSGPIKVIGCKFRCLVDDTHEVDCPFPLQINDGTPCSCPDKGHEGKCKNGVCTPSNGKHPPPPPHSPPAKKDPVHKDEIPDENHNAKYPVPDEPSGNPPNEGPDSNPPTDEGGEDDGEDDEEDEDDGELDEETDDEEGALDGDEEGEEE